MAEMTRREGLGLAAAVGGVAALSASNALAKVPGAPLVTRVDFNDAKWNRDTFARLDMDVNPSKVKVGWMKGTAYGVRDNEAVKPLFVNEGFSVVRSQRLEDGSWRRMLREVVFYRDLKTGQILKTWNNPYTGESVKVYNIHNDPFNFTIKDTFPEPPSYGGLNKDKPPPRPFIQNWSEGPNGTLVLLTDIHLFYPSALQPDKWPRESAGPYTRASELFSYVVKRSDVENANITSLPTVGSWSRVTPWLPWMMMGQAKGHMMYFDTFATVSGIDAVPKDIVEAARAIDPKFLDAPSTDYGPSYSSLENYARDEKPAPVPAGWAPPEPPAAPPAPKLRAG